MSLMRNWLHLAVALIAMIVGCSGSAEYVKPPKIDPASAATQALELYDKNHDGKLNQGELAQCPGVLISIEKYDTNNDKMIDEEEFRTRLQSLLKHGTGGTELAAHVIYQGKPLAGATVVFEPEPYLGDDIQTGQGVTSNAGIA